MDSQKRRSKKDYKQDAFNVNFPIQNMFCQYAKMPNLSPVCYVNDYVFSWKLGNNANLCLKLTVTIRRKLQNHMKLYNSLLI